MAVITAQMVLAHARSLRGLTVVTLSQRKPFRVEVHGDGIWFVPGVSDTPRKHDRQTLEEICKRYDKTKSLRPVDYQDITWNGSYTLALVKQLADAGRRTTG